MNEFERGKPPMKGVKKCPECGGRMMGSKCMKCGKKS